MEMMTPMESLCCKLWGDEQGWLCCCLRKPWHCWEQHDIFPSVLRKIHLRSASLRFKQMVWPSLRPKHEQQKVPWMANVSFATIWVYLKIEQPRIHRSIIVKKAWWPSPVARDTPKVAMEHADHQDCFKGTSTETVCLEIQPHERIIQNLIWIRGLHRCSCDGTALGGWVSAFAGAVKWSTIAARRAVRRTRGPGPRGGHTKTRSHWDARKIQFQDVVSAIKFRDPTARYSKIGLGWDQGILHGFQWSTNEFPGECASQDN